MTEGAHLAIINSEVEAQKLAKLFEAVTEHINGSENSGLAWLGFHDHFQTRDFVTVHGDALVATGYSDWNVGDPSGGGERCGTMNKQGRLNDYFCFKNIIVFCETPTNVLSVNCNS
ncbi:hemolymph lipopolysaccharide-binding protein-like [Athalia rosae]|uniref:hemolymph lipopolysaccharide-binding protein-like n=1 Tax=Athalia rosae TaxID=37344 RepID=UPI00203349A8|nr:hemolymph lipopolysaccharide-binding protein-like [Athalia rosae]